MPEWLLAVIIGLIASLPGFYAGYNTFFKNKADAASTYHDLALKRAKECDEMREKYNKYYDLYHGERRKRIKLELQIVDEFGGIPVTVKSEPEE